MSKTLHLAEQLIARASTTPSDAGCQELIAQRLRAIGFSCETIVSGPADFSVTNLWAKRAASHVEQAQGASNSIAELSTSKTLVFAGHTDVVPTGPVAQWDSPPFLPTHRNGKLYGRGSSDMKVSLAALWWLLRSFWSPTPTPG
jgi:succinyl-diaminopimelate desuccinylase